MTNERELVNVLTKIFPTECWDEDSEKASLTEVTSEDVRKLYRKLWLLDPSELSEVEEPQITKKISSFALINCDSDDADCSAFLTEDFNTNHEAARLSSSQLAQNVIEILKKLVEIENASVLGQTDQNSVTMCCLHFSLDTLHHLHDALVFNADDQTVIKMKLMELTFLCFNNLVNRDGKSIEPVFKKLFHLLEQSDDVRISCGLILNILAILNNLCVKKSIQKTENLNMFRLCNHLILKRMEILSVERELLHVIHQLLIRIIGNVRTAHRMRLGEKKKKKRTTDIDWVTHHDSTADACIFERLLIDSFPFIKSFTRLERILNYFRAKGVCCCNGNIETIRIFMRPSLIAFRFLSFVQEKVLQPMMIRKRICIFCNDKLGNSRFTDEYFKLLRDEIHRREGWELHALLHHLMSVQKIFAGEFLRRFIFEVIVPTLAEEKARFFSDVELHIEAKLIVTTCLSIINESMKEEAIKAQFFTSEMIFHLKDCSLVPAMASNACLLLKIAFDNLKLLLNDGQRESAAQAITSILFSNVLYLIRELMEIYRQIDLPKDVKLSTSQDSSDRALDKSSGDSSDFEILDVQTVAVKEALTDMDVLLLNTIHWNILCDLITNDAGFQHDFVANIYNNFSGNILFTIAYNALNSILLKKELTNIQLRVVSPEPSMNAEALPVMFERSEILSPVITADYDVSFERVMEASFRFFEISESLSDKIRAEPTLIYRLRRDNGVRFRAIVHKDVFLTDNVNESQTRSPPPPQDDHFYFYQNLLNHLWIGIFEGKAIRDRFIKIVNRFVRTEEELQAIHRANVIKEITGRCGIKYLSSIARNCFDICWRLSDNISFSKFAKRILIPSSVVQIPSANANVNVKLRNAKPNNCTQPYSNYLSPTFVTRCMFVCLMGSPGAGCYQITNNMKNIPSSTRPCARLYTFELCCDWSEVEKCSLYLQVRRCRRRWRS